MKTPDLFPETKPPRARHRVLMHVSDARGDGPPDDVWCQMTCVRCAAETDWLLFRSVTESKRGIPCPDCNKEKS
jgi:hypothetical protein